MIGRKVLIDGAPRIVVGVLPRDFSFPNRTAAAYISFLPMVMGGGIWPVLMTPGQNPADAEAASLRFVTPGFFATAGAPLRRGRDVTEADVQNAPAVAVVSESFAPGALVPALRAIRVEAATAMRSE